MSGIVQSPLWGMGKSIALEHPELHCVRMDLDGASVDIDTDAAAILNELLSPSGEDQLACRGTTRYAARLGRHRVSRAQKQQVQFRTDATYLITGGTQGLGLLTAQWMAQHGARHLVLTARSDTGAAEIQKLRDDGVNAVFMKADVSDAQQVAEILTTIDNGWPLLRGIIHSAGVLADGALLEQSEERFDRVFRPKVDGAWNLHTQTLHQPLDFFVLFSSAASLLGSAAQANHSAANAFLDALAHYRRSQGLPALSINWGAWSSIGSAAGPEVEARLAMHGMGTISPEQGLGVLEYLMSSPAPQAGVIPVDWTKVLQKFPRGGEPRFFSLIANEQRWLVDRSQQVDSGSSLSHPRDGSRDEYSGWLQGCIRDRVAASLRLPSAQVSPNKPLSHMGLDSLMAIEIRNRLKAELQLDVPVVKFLDGRSIAELANEVAGSMMQPASEGLAPDTSATITPEAAEELLTRLDDLSDDQVDALLAAAATGNRG